MFGENFQVLPILAACGVAFLLTCPQPRLLIFRILATPLLFVLLGLGYLGFFSVNLGKRITVFLELDSVGYRRRKDQIREFFQNRK